MVSEQYLHFEHGLIIITHVFTTNTNKSFNHNYIIETENRKLQYIITLRHKNIVLITLHKIKKN